MRYVMNVNEVAISRKKISGEVPMVANVITDSCVYTGLFGSLDSLRMGKVTDSITELCSTNEINQVIIDLSNVDAIDSAVSLELVRLGDVLHLLGIKPIFCGISSHLARIMVSTGVEVVNYPICRDLKEALAIALKISGHKIVKID